MLRPASWSTIPSLHALLKQEFDCLMARCLLLPLPGFE